MWAVGFDVVCYSWYLFYYIWYGPSSTLSIRDMDDETQEIEIGSKHQKCGFGVGYKGWIVKTNKEEVLKNTKRGEHCFML